MFGRALGGLALTLVLGPALGACVTAPTPSDGTAASATLSATPEPIALANGSGGLLWGDGAYGLVLVHGAAYDATSWGPQAAVFAQHGMTVLAVERADAESLVAAIGYLHDARGVERVAVLAASAGAAAAMTVGRERPEMVDQLLLLSGSGEVASLGDFPKLFAASEGEPAAVDARRMADEAPGDWNALYLAPGAAHAQAIFATAGGEPLLDAFVRRLEERR